MNSQSILRASGVTEREGRDPAAILATMNDLCTPEGLPELIELARTGRLDRGMDGCFGITWTNVAHRALELIAWVLSEFGRSLPSADLDRIMTLRAVGVNWVHGGDGPSPTGEGLSNCGIFEFDTSRLRRAAWELLKQDRRSSSAIVSVPRDSTDSPAGGEQMPVQVYAVSRTVSQLRPIAHPAQSPSPELASPSQRAEGRAGSASAGEPLVPPPARSEESSEAESGPVAERPNTVPPIPTGTPWPPRPAPITEPTTVVPMPASEPSVPSGAEPMPRTSPSAPSPPRAAEAARLPQQQADKCPSVAAAQAEKRPSVPPAGLEARPSVAAAQAEKRPSVPPAGLEARPSVAAAQAEKRPSVPPAGLEARPSMWPTPFEWQREPSIERRDESSGITEGEDPLNALIEQNQDAIRRYPVAAKPYRALYQLYSRKRNYDGAFCASQVLSYLGMANEAEQRFFDTHRPKGLLRVTGKLDHALWGQNVVHSAEDGDLSRMMEILAEPALRQRLHLENGGANSTEAVAPVVCDQRTDTVLVRMFDWASAVFGIDRPKLLVRDDRSTTLAMCPSEEPTSVAGRATLSGMHPRELTFLVGKHLSGYRPAYRAWSLLPDVEHIRAFVMGAMRAADPRAAMELVHEIAGNPVSCKEHASVGAFLREHQLQRLTPIIRSYVQVGTVPDIVRWLQSVELTMCRAGLLLSGDLGAASKVLYHASTSIPNTVSEQDKIEDLLVFSVSPQYFEVRRALGVSLELAT